MSGVQETQKKQYPTDVVNQAKQDKSTGIKMIGLGALLFLGAAGMVTLSVLQIKGGADLGPYLLAAGVSGFIGVGGGAMVAYGGVQLHYAQKVINGEGEPKKAPPPRPMPTNDQLFAWGDDWIEKWYDFQLNPWLGSSGDKDLQPQPNAHEPGLIQQFYSSLFASGD